MPGEPYTCGRTASCSPCADMSCSAAACSLSSDRTRTTAARFMTEKLSSLPPPAATAAAASAFLPPFLAREERREAAAARSRCVARPRRRWLWSSLLQPLPNILDNDAGAEGHHAAAAEAVIIDKDGRTWHHLWFFVQKGVESRWNYTTVADGEDRDSRQQRRQKKGGGGRRRPPPQKLQPPSQRSTPACGSV